MKQVPTRKALPAIKEHEPLIFADSLEVMEEHCNKKLRLLYESLNRLSIADDTHEIIAICSKIKKEKAQLARIALQKRRANYLC